ncbi:MAG: FHA domain-containing protein [Deltaproteobacteria bacterium]|nr:FHA domain-containing protein [Deltaproteobacteria bacterium]
MPTFVVHSLGSASQKVTVESSPVRIGRDPTNEIVLSDETVSREHALVIRSPDGRWQVSCVSDTNPIVVDGKLTSQGLGVVEGSEMLIGASHLLVFSENEFKADRYIHSKPTFARNRCTRCDWSGMISTLKRNTACPKCACKELTPVDTYTKGTSQAPAPRQAATAMLDPAAARHLFDALRTAKGSHLERIDAHASAAPRTALTEDKPVLLGKVANPDLCLRGLTFGEVTIAWEDSAFTVTSGMLFPALKVNGTKTKKAKLRSGDELAIGGNRFRFVTE